MALQHGQKAIAKSGRHNFREGQKIEFVEISELGKEVYVFIGERDDGSLFHQHLIEEEFEIID